MARPLLLRGRVVDLVRGDVWSGPERTSRLESRELELLSWLARNPEQPLSREMISREIWRRPWDPQSRAIDLCVARVRSKIELDRAHPYHLITVRGYGYRFVPWVPTPSRAPETSELIGRKAEVRDLSESLERGAAIGLVLGPPGIGKTRVARHLAWRYPGAVSWVDLSGVRDLGEVVARVSHSLGLRGPERLQSALHRVGTALRERGGCLVVLDDCEGAAASVGSAVAGWRSQAPFARFLLTSRIEVPVTADRVVELGPLPTADGVRLFEDVAAAVRGHGFEGRTALVERIVERLEGVPLAITLAAGRVGALSLEAIQARLDERFRLLAAGPRDVDPRHRSLLATLDWSWTLLSPEEQRALCACSVFRGGFDRDAGRAVIGPRADVLLDALQRHRLMGRDDDRFWSWTFIQEYAAARLEETPALRRELFDHHADEYARRCPTEPFVDATEALVRERSNLLVATERSLSGERTATSNRLGLATMEVVLRDGPWETAAEIGRSILACPDLSTRDRLVLECVLRTVEHWTGPSRSAPIAPELLEEARRAGAHDLVSRARRAASVELYRTGHTTEALAASRESVAAARLSSDDAVLCVSLCHLAVFCLDLGRVEDGARGYTDILAVLARGSDPQPPHAMNVSPVEWRLGHYTAAARRIEVDLDRATGDGNLALEALKRSERGLLWTELGRLREARGDLAFALRSSREFGWRSASASGMAGLGVLEGLCGAFDLARGYLEAAIAAFDELQEPRSAALARCQLGVVQREAGELEASRGSLVEGTAALGAMGVRSHEAVFLAKLAEVHLLRGDREVARSTIDRADPDFVAAPLRRSQILVARGLVEHAEGRSASDSLLQAEILARGAGSRSESGRGVERLRARG